MKAFLIALCALIVITVGANQILMSIGLSAEAVSASSANVRIDD
ncbi:hypothetical protein FHS72_000006 [Loktanella ponticola]|uniref:Uncharacterized protein n=1 Tax=Yoonia ponticola TaxID=1524255 RepID=A0A7W9BH18_9RHOB|nr:hypothetical protein [Yoonia ponticola]MBB5720402.1 hypothetical protein [Yoonia ponticola]